MKAWTNELAAELARLEAVREQAEVAYDEGIAQILERAKVPLVFRDVGPTRDAVFALFRENGQAILDMLLEHFDPSPRATHIDAC